VNLLVYNSWQAGALGLIGEEFGNGDGEAGQKFRRFDQSLSLQENVRSVGFQNLHAALFGIRDPNGVGTVSKILLHFAHELADVAPGGKDFNCQIGGAFPKPLTEDTRHAFGTDDGGIVVNSPSSNSICTE